MRALVAALRPLEDIVSDLSGDNYVTASAVLPVLHLLEAGFEGDDEALPYADDLDDDLEFDINDFKPSALREFVVKKLKKRFCPDPLDEEELALLNPQMQATARIDFKSAQQCHDLLVQCSFLDPRYKGEILAEEREKAKRLLTEQFVASIGEGPTTDNRNGDSSAQGEQESTTNPRKRSALQSLFAKKKRAPQEGVDGAATAVDLTPEAKFAEELARYDNLPTVSMEVDIRLWWKERFDSYPMLQKQARRYLSICASSTPSERLFSDGGNVVTDSRCCLSDSNASNLIFLSSNRKFIKRPV
ncbi:E3 SUMO-protein ligase ZBED1-like [Frankliniella occidentalis]|uniref:E3 SUMO-protein ligase ZBED1-like n=1 Tax=Frankliniella occidentalis TaxID=133901 RepID=A0A9C6X9I7_FRAOC|nr:E3 SUMO-protein ligase ZBED1-like [Frankliniella occidentalis]